MKGLKNLENAKMNKFIRTKGTDAECINNFFHWCQENNLPFIQVHDKQKWAVVDGDYISINLSDQEIEAKRGSMIEKFENIIDKARDNGDVRSDGAMSYGLCFTLEVRDESADYYAKSLLRVYSEVYNLNIDIANVIM